jgi:hypothetical protein
MTVSSSVSKDWNLDPAFDDDTEKFSRKFVGGLTSSVGYCVSPLCGFFLKRRELALQKQMPGPSGASGVEGPARAPPQTPSWVARGQRPGTEGARLGRAFAWASGMTAFSLRRVVSVVLADISSEALACGGVGVREKSRWATCVAAFVEALANPTTDG